MEQENTDAFEDAAIIASISAEIEKLKNNEGTHIGIVLLSTNLEDFDANRKSLDEILNKITQTSKRFPDKLEITLRCEMPEATGSIQLLNKDSIPIDSSPIDASFANINIQETIILPCIRWATVDSEVYQLMELQFTGSWKSASEEVLHLREQFAIELTARNERLGFDPPLKLTGSGRAQMASYGGDSGITLDTAKLDASKLVAKSDSYPVRTAQETNALFYAISDSNSGNNWTNDLQAGTRTHQRSGKSHSVCLQKMDGEELADIEDLTSRLNADGVLIASYIINQIAPAGDPINQSLRAWIDLDDVSKKTMSSDRRSNQERLELRRKVLDLLTFGERAQVNGSRSTSYRDETGKEIPTRIESPLWKMLAKEYPEQRTLFESAEAPVRVEVALSTAWIPLLTEPKLAQYLPMAELLGGIRYSQASGSWARSIGITLLNIWRRRPHETINGEFQPTREELLNEFPPKMTPLFEILESANPKRARDYWDDALHELVKIEFIAGEGEPRNCRTIEYPRQGWQDKWRQEKVQIHPGAKTLPYVQKCADNLPQYKPKSLSKCQKKTKTAPPT